MEPDFQICQDCTINFVNRIQLCVEIHLASIVRHNLKAMAKGCGLFNISPDLPIYQRDCLKVRV